MSRGRVSEQGVGSVSRGKGSEQGGEPGTKLSDPGTKTQYLSKFHGNNLQLVKIE